ncbi:MAG: VWA domain-containing protein [Spirochaetaceae bacterium]|nr:VWA domain-containing protein [Spirochaetaceae bacterium]
MPLIATGGALRFVHPEAFLLLWLLLPLAAALYLAGRARRRDARRFRAVPEQGTPASGARPLLAALILTGMALLVIGIARPGWESSPTTVERRGRDVVFVVDTSRSMLAEDLAPNRLERAKLAILDAVENLDGDRVALVAYAGSAVVKSPLTFDYGFFRMAVRQLSATSVSRGGSLLGDALRTVHDDVLDNQVREFKDVLLITDGGDHDSFPVEAAEALGQSGARILAIGLGDDTAGQPIPDLRRSGRADAAYVEHDGQIVLSALDADLLRAVAGATPAGRYVHWATGNLDLGRLYREMIAAAPGRLLEAEAVELINERFQIFLGLALLLFAVTAAVPDRLRLPRLFVGRLGALRRRQRTPEVQPTAAARRRSAPHQVRGAASG